MFVKKKDGRLRLCVDYRALNEVTKKDRYPLPLIREALDRLSTAKYFTKLDIKDAYHNIRIKEGDEWKTTFSCKRGIYEYMVVPFGLTNAPAAFQRWINNVLAEFLDICCIVYLDDILIYSDTREQHRKDVRNILEALRPSGMKAKPSKCEFHQTETEYLGFIISNEGVKMDPVKTEAIQEWENPKKVKEVQVFLDFATSTEGSSKDSAEPRTPLYELMHKKNKDKWHWGEKEQEAFNELRRKLTTAPVLIHFDPTKPINIETDPSKYVCSGILSQPGGTWKMETCSVPLPDDEPGGMQLRRSQQGTVSSYPSIPRVETIHHGKPTPDSSVDGP